MRTWGLDLLVVAGGVGGTVRLRSVLDAGASPGKFTVFYPALEFCTDNGAMIALAGCLRLKADEAARALPLGFTARPRWDLAGVAPPGTPGETLAESPVSPLRRSSPATGLMRCRLWLRASSAAF